MSKERKPCQSIFRGLVVGRKNPHEGLYAAIENGECEVIAYVAQSDRTELIALEKEVANAFLQGERLPII